MNATNTLSTKSTIVWRANLQPSDLFASLYCLAMLLALVSLWHCPIHWGYRVLLMFITAAGGLKILLASRKSVSIACCEDGSWVLIESLNQYSGQLSSGCYRSMLLVVLAIKPALGATRYAVVWRDCVPEHEFSALHIRLALSPVHQLR